MTKGARRSLLYSTARATDVSQASDNSGTGQRLRARPISIVLRHCVCEHEGARNSAASRPATLVAKEETGSRITTLRRGGMVSWPEVRRRNGPVAWCGRIIGASLA